MTIFTGTSGDDSILGTGGPDDFHIEQGGEDSASGGAGIDVFYLGAGFDAGDRIDGGTGKDFLLLAGDYSAGVELTATTLTNVEVIQLAAGSSYKFTGFTDANIGGGTLAVAASALTVGDDLTIDATGVATGRLSVIGGKGANDLTGGDGADTLDGSQGVLAILHGGKGDDSLAGSATGADILGGGQGNDFISYGSGAALVQGGAGDDFIGMTDPTVQSSATVDGGDGADSLAVLWLGDGASITGGEGDDTIGVYRHAAASAVVDGGGGFDTLTVSDNTGTPVLISGDQFRNFEALQLGATSEVVLDDGVFAKGLTVQVTTSSNAPVSLDASAEKNAAFVIHAGELNDSLVGGGGDDDMGGGKGDDVLIGNKGDDTLNAGFGSDLLSGGAGDDVLNGGSGARFSHSADTLLGGAGDDLITSVDSLIVKGGGGDDTVTASSRGTHIWGNAGEDHIIGGGTLEGGAGDDMLDNGTELIGGAGQDTLSGGSRYTYEKLADSLVGAADQIANAQSAIIDLRLVDADATQDGDQAFHLVDAFTGHAGELVESVDDFRSVSMVLGDVDGDGTADFEIDIGSTLDGTSFLL